MQEHEDKCPEIQFHGRDGISQSLPEICAALGFELDADPRAGDVLRVVREQEDGAIFEFLFNRTRNTVTADRPAGDMLICSLATDSTDKVTLEPNGVLAFRR